MGERTYTGKSVDSKDGFEATASDTFFLIKIEHGRGETLTLDTGEAEAFARWVLKIHPFGNKRIT